MARRLPYKLDPEPLGRGGYGVVHRATHRESGDVVALKKALAGAVSLKRMQREISSQQSFAHENIMPILDADAGVGRWFTMPLADTTLAKLMAQQSVDEPQLVNILYAAARALQYAHNLGHVHRDVTPNNLLRITHGRHGRRWVVGDWGLVQKPEGQTSLPLTAVGQPLGTREFGPPEAQGAASGVGPEFDVFYLGAVASWVVTGVMPFEGRVETPTHEPWRTFVATTAQRNPTQRLGSMIPVLAMLHEMRETQHPVVAATGDSMHPCPHCHREAPGLRCDFCGRFVVDYN